MQDAATRPPLETVPALGVSYTINLDEKRALVVQTHIDGEATPAEINALFDKIMNAGDRKELFYRLDKLNKEIEDHEKMITRIKIDFEAIDATHRARYEDQKKNGHRGAFKLSATETAAKDNTGITLKRYEEELSLRLKEKRRIEKIVSG